MRRGCIGKEIEKKIKKYQLVKVSPTSTYTLSQECQDTPPHTPILPHTLYNIMPYFFRITNIIHRLGVAITIHPSLPPHILILQKHLCRFYNSIIHIFHTFSSPSKMYIPLFPWSTVYTDTSMYLLPRIL